MIFNNDIFMREVQLDKGHKKKEYDIINVVSKI